jgi:diguanylate cyclase (GGDEF)-like protein
MQRPAWFQPDSQASVPLAYQQQCLLDLVVRMRNGLVIYPAIWLILTQMGGFASRHPGFVFGNGLALVAFSLLRMGFHRQIPHTAPEALARTYALFRSLSVLYNLYWGTLCALIMAAPDAGTLRWMMLVATVGITTGLTVIVGMDRYLPRLLPIALLAPNAIGVLLSHDPDAVAIVLASLTVVIYAFKSNGLVAKEYWGRQQSNAMLEAQAKELTSLSRTDALTQVPNRLSFQENLTRAWAEAQSNGKPLAVAMVDLDHFKRINDRWGHPFGDRCLQAAAKAIGASIHKPTDMVARYGGEEFVILLPDTDVSGAMIVAQRVLDQVLQTSLEEGVETIQLSCSIGVAACHPSPREGADQLVQDADQALYVAKHQGRARVVAHQAITPPPPAADIARARISSSAH